MSKSVQITCGTCSAEVVVKKFSWHHTTVQWNAATASNCTELGAPSVGAHDIAAMRSCPRLRDAINVAAVEGKFGNLD
ncbi:hypothetical protein FFI94_027560 [Rhodococcus sp. KBS0724]|uniref:hypothetical protein n=1 Tax=Rhodococcus sp. KBS0724 TaxID=1179674 RepID=UPI0011872AC0|nr:hypothetical protein [Rhodococcus sp. KBS0724]TSD49529.1 hypothetical protein FFI94_027560 [Rhodococcus sp. KBS0724]